MSNEHTSSKKNKSRNSNENNEKNNDSESRLSRNEKFDSGFF